RFVISGCSGEVQVWDVNTGREVRHFEGRGSHFETFSPDARFAIDIVSGGSHLGGGFCVWGVESEREVICIDYREGFCYAFSPDSQRVISGEVNGSVKLWDVKTGRVRRGFVGQRNKVHTVAISLNGKRAFPQY